MVDYGCNFQISQKYVPHVKILMWQLFQDLKKNLAILNFKMELGQAKFGFAQSYQWCQVAWFSSQYDKVQKFLACKSVSKLNFYFEAIFLVDSKSEESGAFQISQ